MGSRDANQGNLLSFIKSLLNHGYGLPRNIFNKIKFLHVYGIGVKIKTILFFRLFLVYWDSV